MLSWLILTRYLATLFAIALCCCVTATVFADTIRRRPTTYQGLSVIYRGQPANTSMYEKLSQSSMPSLSPVACLNDAQPSNLSPPVTYSGVTTLRNELPPCTFVPESDIRRGSNGRTRHDRLYRPLLNEGRRVVQDFKNLYSRDPMLNFAVGLGAHAIISNTAMDQNFRNWYQEDVRSEGMDNTATFFKTFGEGLYFVPVMFAGDVIYRYCQDAGMFARGKSPVGEFFSRTTRAYLVGAPTLLVGQYVIGASRPNDYRSYHSNWSPFSDNNSISGHAFMGATPFIVAAQMSDRFMFKAAFYTLSVMPGWSRINDDAHYLSQVVLGWYLSYLSVRAVNQTDGVRLPKGMTIFPITEADTVGIGFLWKR